MRPPRPFRDPHRRSTPAQVKRGIARPRQAHKESISSLYVQNGQLNGFFCLRTSFWRQNLLKHGTSGRKRVLLAASDARVLGFARIGAEQEAHQNGLVYLLYIRPELWGRGVGTALMHAAMDSLVAFYEPHIDCIDR